MDYVDERQRLDQHWEGESETDLDEYWAKKNAASIDGLPALD